MAENTIKQSQENENAEFFWPYNHREIQQHLDSWVEKMCDLADKIGAQAPSNARALHGGELIYINILKWQPVMVQAFQTLLLKQGFEKKGLNPPIDPETMKFWHAYINTDEPLEDDRYVKALINGPPTEPLWKTALRYVRDVTQGKAVTQKPTFLYDPKKDLTLTVSCAASNTYCEMNNRKGVYQGSETWFVGVSEDEITARNDPALDEILALTWQHFDGICTLEDRMKDWIKRQISMSYYMTAYLSEKALKSPQKLPKELIAGVSAPWAILLRYLVHKNGAHVSVFDHGAGAVLSFPRTTYLNYVCGSTVFYTYTDYAARHYKTNIDEKTRFSLEKGANITWHPALARSPLSKSPEKQSKKILLIPFYDMRDYNLSYGYPSWKQSQKFNQALVKMLKNLGYEITLKFHPEFYIAPEKELKELYDCPVSYQPFEKIMDEFECVVTCDANSSTFISIILKEKPCIAYDFLGFADRPFRKDIEDRIEIIPVDMNSDNSLQPRSILERSHFIRAKDKAQSQNLKALYLNEEQDHA